MTPRTSVRSKELPNTEGLAQSNTPATSCFQVKLWHCQLFHAVDSLRDTSKHELRVFNQLANTAAGAGCRCLKTHAAHAFGSTTFSNSTVSILLRSSHSLF